MVQRNTVAILLMNRLILKNDIRRGFIVIFTVGIIFVYNFSFLLVFIIRVANSKILKNGFIITIFR